MPIAVLLSLPRATKGGGGGGRGVLYLSDNDAGIIAMQLSGFPDDIQITRSAVSQHSCTSDAKLLACKFKLESSG